MLIRRLILTSLLALPNFQSSLAQSHPKATGETILLVEHSELIPHQKEFLSFNGYLVIRNNSNNFVSVEKIASSNFAVVRIQKTKKVGNNMIRVPMEMPLFIPGNSELVMKKTGIFLELEKPTVILSQDQLVTLSITLANKLVVSTNAIVKSIESIPIDHHHGEEEKT